MFDILYTWKIEENGVATGEELDISVKFEYEEGYPDVVTGPPDSWEPGCPDIVYDYEFSVVAYRNAYRQSWDVSEMLDEDKVELLEEFLGHFDRCPEFQERLEEICLEHVHSFDIPEWEPTALSGYPEDYTDCGGYYYEY